jgi:hypothetical protein
VAVAVVVPRVLVLFKQGQLVGQAAAVQALLAETVTPRLPLPRKVTTAAQVQLIRALAVLVAAEAVQVLLEVRGR